MKFRLYKGGFVSGLLTLKLDGIRAHYDGHNWLSRAGKALYNLPHDLPSGTYEVYVGSWEDTMTAVRTHNSTIVDKQYLYSLDPVDKRLIICSLENELPPPIIEGTEGYVLHTKGDYVKIKKSETFDVEVVGLQEGTNKYKGKLGAILTTRGKVGTGFTDEQRSLFYTTSFIGAIVEVACMELTKEGKFRHPRFVRVREDR